MRIRFDDTSINASVSATRGSVGKFGEQFPFDLEKGNPIEYVSGLVAKLRMLAQNLTTPEEVDAQSLDQANTFAEKLQDAAVITKEPGYFANGDAPFTVRSSVKATVHNNSLQYTIDKTDHGDGTAHYMIETVGTSQIDRLIVSNLTTDGTYTSAYMVHDLHGNKKSNNLYGSSHMNNPRINKEAQVDPIIKKLAGAIKNLEAQGAFSLNN
jgi:hypothetical protein